jgi:hypothetical protein
MKPLFTLAALALCLTLAACASLTKDECLSGNWEEIGFRDGTNGQTSARFQSHVKACEKVSVTPNQSLWEKGRTRGLPAYCVPEKAYREGRNGNELRAVCPASQMPALQAANSKGLDYYQINEDIREAENTVSEVEFKLVGADDPLVRAALVSELSSLRARISLLQLRRTRYDSL